MRAQLSGRDDKLVGKYKGMRHRIFVDDEWKSDAAFVAESRRQYEAQRIELEPLLREVGQPDIDEQIAELDAASTSATEISPTSPT